MFEVIPIFWLNAIWGGHLNDYPDPSTPGVDLHDLKIHLRDPFEHLTR